LFCENPRRFVGARISSKRRSALPKKENKEEDHETVLALVGAFNDFQVDLLD
jgi:hypothetical protein